MDRSALVFQDDDLFFGGVSRIRANAIQFGRLQSDTPIKRRTTMSAKIIEFES